MQRIATISLLVMLIGIAGVLQANPEKPREGTRQGPGSSSQTVALFDMERAFQASDEFRTQMKVLKIQVKAARERVKREVDELGLRTDSSDSDSPESSDLAREQLRTDIHSGQTFLLDRESEIYLKVYQGLLKEVRAYCGEHGIAVVYRVPEDEPALDSASDVVKATEKELVCYGPDVRDITDEIIERVNARLSGK